MTFSIVTPSYLNDYERCVLLTESIEKWVPKHIGHCIIVDERDYPLFAGLANARTRVLTQESIVAGRFWPVPFGRKWRVSWNAPPMRGWMWQQLVKLSIASAVDSDAIMIVDSDVIFVKPFDPNDLLRDGRVPLFREEGDYFRRHEKNQAWHAAARKLLGLPRRSEPFSTGYVGAYGFWRRDVLRRLNERFRGPDRRTTLPRRLARLVTFSEYVLYGTYVDDVEGLAESGHYVLESDLCHSYWSETPLDAARLRAFRDETPPEKVLVMINGKSGTPVDDIRRVFFTER